MAAIQTIHMIPVIDLQHGTKIKRQPDMAAFYFYIRKIIA